MKDDPFKILKEIFDKLSGQSGMGGDDAAADAIRSAASQAKSVVDDLQQKFPPDLVNQMVTDLYSQLNGQQLINGLAAAGFVGEEKIKGLVEGLVSGLKNRDTALAVAKGLKEILNQTGTDDLVDQLQSALDQSGASLEMRLVVQMFLMQAKPLLEEMKNDPEAVIADKIMMLADTIPAAVVAQLVGGLTAGVAARISQQTEGLVSKLPAPDTVSNLVYGVTTLASLSLDRIANSNSPEEVSGIVSEFVDNAQTMIGVILSADKAAKNAPVQKEPVKKQPVKKAPADKKAPGKKADAKKTKNIKKGGQFDL